MNICMMAYTYYDLDNRVRRYAETLVREGHTVSAIALFRGDEESEEYIEGVRVYRIQKRIINERSMFSYLYRVLKFFFLSTIFVTKCHLKNPFDVIHVHSVPDFEVFAAIIPKLQGCKIILDIHDIVPEFFASKFSKGKKSFFFQMLVSIEKFSAKFADHVIISNHIWEKTLLSRSVPKKKLTTILNFPNERIFKEKQVHNTKNPKIILYPGTINWHQGLDIAVRAFNIIHNQHPDYEFHIYGGGSGEKSLRDLIKELNLENKVIINSFVSIDKVAKLMATSNIGIIPKRDDPFGGQAFSTKSLEFMAVGIPVIISRTKIDNFYFNNKVVKFFTPGDENDLANRLCELIDNPITTEKQTMAAKDFVKNYQWYNNRHIYIDLLDNI